MLCRYALATLCLSAVCLLGCQPPQDTGNAIQADAEWVGVNIIDVDAMGTAESLIQHYDENEYNADLMFRGRMLGVEGTVTNISTGLSGAPEVTLDASWGLGGIQCRMHPKQAPERIAALRKGDRITVAGVCRGRLISISLDECFIIDSMGTEP